MSRIDRFHSLAGQATWNGARDLAACLRFFSRLPLPALPFDDDSHAALDLARLAPMVPIAGALLAAIGALALGLAHRLGLPPLVCATIAVSALVLVTGALHEDGLADVADGFGGGATRERKLAIMRDSRIGTFGAAALALSLMLRVCLLAALLGHGAGAAAAGLIVAGAASRGAALLPLTLLPAARADGLGAANALETGGAFAACLVAFIVAAALGVGFLGFGRAMLGFILALAAALAMTWIARRQIGGQTGDVAGATQQMAEIACLCGLLIGRAAA
jgi:adenosylcobinamide-GDP ribazoletransferase